MVVAVAIGATAASGMAVNGAAFEATVGRVAADSVVVAVPAEVVQVAVAGMS